jgi:hypothetical protein
VHAGGSDHRVLIWETKRDPTTNTLPSKVGERIRRDISRMSEDDKDEAELLWLTASETRPTLDYFSFCEDIDSETLWIEETFTKILNQKADGYVQDHNAGGTIRLMPNAKLLARQNDVNIS